MATFIGIDVGGTFTDLFCRNLETGEEKVLKVPSTPDQPARGLLDALKASQVPPDEIAALIHGTTIATNAVIERRGARCALITTMGFRDVLELGRRDRPDVFGLTGTQNPLIPRDRRWEVSERLDHNGQVLTPIAEDEVRRLGAIFKADGIESIVVSFLHAYANPQHEHRAREILLEIDPGFQIVLGTDVLREQYEFERTSTAVVQGFLQPLVGGYAAQLTASLHEYGYDKDTLVMQSNGGVISLSQLGNRAAHIIRSGPAAGVVAAARIAEQAGFRNVITGDMGGTSYDVAVIIDGQPDVAETTLLDFRMPLKIPMIDVHTIGAGGGSIGWIDRGGLLHVGPRSAGAFPGPVCYRKGGTEPTITDANLVLGRINADKPIGGGNGERLDVEAARAAIGTLGEQLGLGVEETASAMLAIANQTMAGRTRLMTVERGLDPRSFALVIFGGAGPLHGAAIFAEVGIGTMIIPPYPGVLCANGCVVADLRYDFAQTFDQPLSELRIEDVHAVFAGHDAEGRAKLDANGVELAAVEVTHVADMSFQGQIHTIRVVLPADADKATIDAAFRTRYQEHYGTAPGQSEPVVVTLRTTTTGVRPETSRAAAEITAATTPRPASQRDVYFDRWHKAAVYWRPDLVPGDVFEGPAIIEQADTTSVIEPGMKVRVDGLGNILVEMA
jgi:N-methylhydantoinase A